MKPLEIATKSTGEQISPILFDELAETAININGDATKLMLFKRYLEAILLIGLVEHSGDWDPYLKITLADGTELETITGYTEISIGDLDGEDEENALNYLEELTSIGFILEVKEDEECKTEEVVSYFHLPSIKSIKLMHS